MNTPVNFKIAKLLKEKGQDFATNMFYPDLSWESKDLYNSLYTEGVDTCQKLDLESWGSIFPAPTIVEVVMWLYEKHGIWIHSSCDVDGNFYPKISFSKEENWFNLELRSKMNAGNREIIILDCKSPTLAYEAAIEYCLNNLI